MLPNFLNSDHEGGVVSSNAVSAIMAESPFTLVNEPMSDFFDRTEPNWLNGFKVGSADLILSSYRRLLGQDMLPTADSGESMSHRLYHAPGVVLAHDTAEDPIFFYGNLAAQALFEFSWPELVKLPSRFSAEPLAREERRRLLDKVAQEGFISNYAGIRISRTGKRFYVANVVVWNLVDAEGTKKLLS